MKKNPRYSSLGASGASRGSTPTKNSSLTGLPVTCAIRRIIRRPVVLRLPGPSSNVPHIWDHPLPSLVVHLWGICLGRIQCSRRKQTGYGHCWPRWRSFGWNWILHPQDEVTHMNDGFCVHTHELDYLACKRTVAEPPTPCSSENHIQSRRPPRARRGSNS